MERLPLYIDWSRRYWIRHLQLGWYQTICSLLHWLLQLLKLLCLKRNPEWDRRVFEGGEGRSDDRFAKSSLPDQAEHDGDWHWRWHRERAADENKTSRQQWTPLEHQIKEREKVSQEKSDEIKSRREEDRRREEESQSRERKNGERVVRRRIWLRFRSRRLVRCWKLRIWRFLAGSIRNQQNGWNESEGRYK